MTPIALFLSFFLVSHVFCNTQNEQYEKTLHQMASEVKVDTPLHLWGKPYASNLKKDIPPTAPTYLPRAIQKNVSPANPTSCENTALLMKLLNILMELLGDHALKFSKDKLILIKKYLDDIPEGSEKHEIIKKIKKLNANEYKTSSEEALRNLLRPRTQIDFKTKIPKIDQQTCKETLANLIQNAYNTYIQLTNFPTCQQNGQYSNVNLDFVKYLPQYKPQDLSFDIKVVNPIDFPYLQQISNNDLNVFYSHLSSKGPSNDLMNLQTQGSNKNIDITSILQNYRPGQTVFTRNEHLLNNVQDPFISNKLKSNLPLYPNNSIKQPLNNPVIDFTNLYNSNDQKSYMYFIPNDSKNVLKFFDNGNNKQPDVRSENVPVNEWKPIFNVLLDGFKNQTVKHPSLEEIVYFSQDNKKFPGNPFLNHSDTPHNKLTSKLFSNSLVVTPNNLNNDNFPIDNPLIQVIPKDNEVVLDPNNNPNLNVLLVLLHKYLPKNINGQFVPLPNVNTLEELAKLFPEDVLVEKFGNVNNLVTLEKLIGLFPKDLLHQIFPNLNIPNNQTPSYVVTPNLLNGNTPDEQVLNTNNYNKDLVNHLFPNLHVPDTNQVNVNIGVNSDTFNNLKFPNFHNNKLFVNPNLGPNIPYSPNFQQAIDYIKPKNPQLDLINSQLYPGPSKNKLLVPDLQRLLAVTNLLKLNSKPNTANVIELTYLLKRPKHLVYEPYYYVKYKLPYVTFVNKMYRLTNNKSNTRSSPIQLYHELISLSNVSDISSDLKGMGKDDILDLVLNKGALVNAKVLSGNDTFLNEQLNIIQNLNSEMQTEELMKLQNDNVKQNGTLHIGYKETLSKAPFSLQINNNVPVKPDFYQPAKVYRTISMYNRVTPYITPLPFYPLQVS